MHRLYIDPVDCERKPAIMGIKQLFSIIKDEAPEAIKEGEIKNQFGRKVAIVCLALALSDFGHLMLTEG